MLASFNNLTAKLPCQIYLPFAHAGFEITPFSNNTAIQHDDVTFNYVIKPWPPPYRGAPGDPYEHVVLTFNYKTSGGLFVKLCVVEYLHGIYDDTTGT